MDHNGKDISDFQFSFIVPVYNSFEYIERCIGSIYSCCISGNVPIEIIVIDDGSIDLSSAKLDSYCDNASWDEDAHLNYDNIRFLICHTVNNGVSRARNMGLRIASGRYVIFVDSDDTIDSQKMLKCINTMVNDNTIDMMIYGMSFEYYHRGKCYRSRILVPPFTGIRKKQVCVDNIDILFDANALSSLCNKIIKRDIIKDLFLCESLSVYEDLEFSLRAFANCRHICFCNESVYHYRQTESESNSIDRLKSVGSVKYVVDKIETALRCSVDNVEHILTSLYALLAIDKIKGLRRSEVGAICDEYRRWIDYNGFKTKNNLLYSGDVNKIYLRLFYTKIKHYIANFVKTF